MDATEQKSALDCPKCGHHEMDATICIGLYWEDICPKCGYKKASLPEPKLSNLKRKYGIPI